ncbi:C6 transcription factor [Colletotrichum asianum]|uniref:C6 transcription factor n=1 Tax=Colletotrichum asianum TaxID=702518 RepID=A0A8H3W5S7_9PEZI|nr:C6 transcription factor [Colletotrichum asianum]
MADDSADQPILKRKRISVACNSCRAKKSKCDGKRPVCGRCAGYDYHCSWGNEATHRDASCTPPLSPSGAENTTSPQEVFGRCEKSIRGLTLDLSPVGRAEINQSLARIQTILFQDHSPAVATVSPNSVTASSPALIQRIQSPRYVGEVSDIHFFNLVRQTAAPPRDARGATDDAAEVDNYDIDAPTTLEYLQNPISDMPERVLVQSFLGIYFSTIHVAYPFVEEGPFMDKLKELQDGNPTPDLTHSWLSLLYALLALGAYYDSFEPESQRDRSAHQKLFQRSLLLSRHDMLERSLTQVSALLAQCFYLLATSEIDRCWAYLGLAVRLAQSIGLHADIQDHGSNQSVPERPQIRSRVWYSLYILDRLTALQLGRPPAISDHDCHVQIPSRIDGLDPEVTDSEASERPKEGRAGEYFVRLIEFSSVIGQVLRECYHPRRDIAARLQSTKDCDVLLLTWKQKLPRYLRFDLGHAFEKSITLKRQRNMMAVKFHHLRALIHRPYLFHPSAENNLLTQDQASRSREYGKICAAEAQSIASLMHNVTDTMDIVMNYPWWQMISCLVCAGSIMVMAGVLLKRDAGNDTTVAALEEDVETCMAVLKALASNSHGANLAWDMMKNIRARCTRASDNPAADDTNSLAPNAAVQSGQGLSQSTYCSPSDTYAIPLVAPDTAQSGFSVEATNGFDMNMGFGENVMWPMMMTDATWPGSFLDMLHPSYGSQENS